MCQALSGIKRLYVSHLKTGLPVQYRGFLEQVMERCGILACDICTETKVGPSFACTWRWIASVGCSHKSCVLASGGPTGNITGTYPHDMKGL